jgi:hypothetical protein
MAKQEQTIQVTMTTETLFTNDIERFEKWRPDAGNQWNSWFVVGGLRSNRIGSNQIESDRNDEESLEGESTVTVK